MVDWSGCVVDIVVVKPHVSCLVPARLRLNEKVQIVLFLDPQTTDDSSEAQKVRLLSFGELFSLPGTEVWLGFYNAKSYRRTD